MWGPVGDYRGRANHPDRSRRFTTEATNNLIAAGVQVQDTGPETLLTFSNTLQQLAQDTLGLDYTLADLPVGTSVGQTVFKDAQGGELGYIDYSINVTDLTGANVTVQLKSNGESAALGPPAPRWLLQSQVQP